MGLWMLLAAAALGAAASSPPLDNIETVALEGKVTFYMEDHFDTAQHYKVSPVINSEDPSIPPSVLVTNRRHSS